ncbi:MAG TPA: ligand-binding protein SH3, partial [Patescibacteria group bacterium]|nr:ligand-binding protein SH3 [Patescibacteria group bacterium]
MEQTLISSMHDFPVELSTFLLAMTPIGELRLSIPIAITVYKMHPLAALLWSIAGNIGITIIVL